MSMTSSIGNKSLIQSTDAQNFKDSDTKNVEKISDATCAEFENLKIVSQIKEENSRKLSISSIKALRKKEDSKVEDSDETGTTRLNHNPNDQVMHSDKKFEHLKDTYDLSKVPMTEVSYNSHFAEFVNSNNQGTIQLVSRNFNQVKGTFELQTPIIKKDGTGETEL
jgi:hypothetical protein